MLNLKIHFKTFLFCFFMLNDLIAKITGVKSVIPDVERHVVIFFHGFGEDGRTWKEKFLNMSLNYTNFIFPTAKFQIPTNDPDKSVSAWFDPIGLKNIEKEDEDRIKRSMNIADTLIREQFKKGIKSTNIIIGGFDQGGSIALLIGVKFKGKLGGIFALSSWLPRVYEKYNETKIISNRNIPILVCHGAKDSVVPVKYGQEIATRLKNITSNVSFKLYDTLEHEIITDEINDIRDFIITNLNAKNHV